MHSPSSSIGMGPLGSQATHHTLPSRIWTTFPVSDEAALILVMPRCCVLCGPRAPGTTSHTLQVHATGSFVPQEYRPHNKQFPPQPAGGGEESRGTRGISLRQQHPRGASGDSDDADEAQSKRWDQRTQKAAGQVLAHLHPGHLCPSYTPFLIHPLLKCRIFRCKQAELQTESQLFQNDPSANTAGFHSSGCPGVDNSVTEVDIGARGSGREWEVRLSWLWNFRFAR